MLDSEIFKDSLREQFKDDIKNLIRECHSESSYYLDIKNLNKRLSGLHDYAVSDGLTEDDWLDLVFELCPDIYDSLDFGPIAA